MSDSGQHTPGSDNGHGRFGGQAETSAEDP
jgi:hypothetical protein